MNAHDDEVGDEQLTAALKAVAEDDHARRSLGALAAFAASPAVRDRLMAEVRSIARARRRRTMTVLAAAAVVAIAVSASVWRIPRLDRGSEPSSSTAVAATTVTTSAETATEFFPLISASASMTASHLVRIEVPHRALAKFGLASMAVLSDASATVLADVMVGDDGLARAVRFIRPATAEEKKQ